MACKRSTTANWSKAKLRKFINNQLAGESSVGIAPELSTENLTITGHLTLAKEKKIIWDNENFTGITTNSYGEMQFAQHNAYMGFLFFSEQDPRYGAGALIVQNTQNSAYGAHLRLWKNRNSAWAAAGTQAGDHLGSIDFVGFDSADSGAPSFPDTTFAQIEAYAPSVTDNTESGKIIMSVMNSGGADDTLNDLLHIGGTDGALGANACAVVINEAGIDSDFRVESAVHNTAIFLQGSDGECLLQYGAAASPGSGFSAGAREEIYIRKINKEIVTTILVDLQGLAGGEASGDVIGNDGASNAYVFSVGAGTPAGWIYKVEMICLEVPTSGLTSDINIVANTSGTIAEDTSGTGGTSITLINAGGAWTNGMRKESPASTVFTSGLYNYFLYLTAGNTPSARGVYGAGKFAIKLHGFHSF